MLWSGLLVALHLGLPAPPAEVFQVPYRLTDTKHVLVRAKLNGQGPFHFILDTGAPALFVSTAVANKVGVKPRGGWGVFEQFAIEGGVVETQVRGRIEDPFQLKGMNGLGLAGAELHGIIGYTLLAKYRIEFDFTRNKLTWVRLDFDPPPPAGLEGGVAGQAGLEFIGNLFGAVGGMLARQPSVVLRGFLGMELKNVGEKVQVVAVLPDSPAARGGVQAGDQIQQFLGQKVSTLAEIQRLAQKLRKGGTAELTVERDGTPRTLALQVGEGF